MPEGRVTFGGRRELKLEAKEFGLYEIDVLQGAQPNREITWAQAQHPGDVT